MREEVVDPPRNPMYIVEGVVMTKYRYIRDANFQSLLDRVNVLIGHKAATHDSCAVVTTLFSVLQSPQTEPHDTTPLWTAILEEKH